MKVARKLLSGADAVSLLAVVIIIFVSFAVYANALQNGFIYDDHSQILKNHLIRDIRNVPEIFRRSAWTFEEAPPTSNYYRPMLNLFYMVVYYAFGLKAWGYHLLNILFHAGNSVLVFLVAARLFGTTAAMPEKGGDTPPLHDSPSTGNHSRFTIHGFLPLSQVCCSRSILSTPKQSPGSAVCRMCHSLSFISSLFTFICVPAKITGGGTYSR